MSTTFTTRDGRVYCFYPESDGGGIFQQIECQPGQYHMGSFSSIEEAKRYLDSECDVKQWEFDTSI